MVAPSSRIPFESAFAAHAPRPNPSVGLPFTVSTVTVWLNVIRVSIRSSFAYTPSWSGAVGSLTALIDAASRASPLSLRLSTRSTPPTLDQSRFVLFQA